jgi:Na+/H+-dicarboxylate symporter
VAGRRWHRSSTFWIFVGLALGVVLGGFLPSDQYPGAYDTFKFISKAFIALIKGLIVPLLFSTIVVGSPRPAISRRWGGWGQGAALLRGGHHHRALHRPGHRQLARPGEGLPLDLTGHTQLAKPLTGWEIAMHLFPSNLVHHAAEGDILPVVVFATLFGVSVTRVGERARIVVTFFEAVAQAMFKYTDMIMRLTPLGVFGAMAYNVSHMAAGHSVGGEVLKGWAAVFHLVKQYAKLVGSLYLALVVLFLVVFVPVMLLCGVRVFRFLRAVRDPAMTAFSTASSEAALPRLLEDVVAFGVPRRVASFVIPTGYSFNLDGSTLYLVVASLTIAQAAHIQMSFGQQLAMVFTFMLTSKGVGGRAPGHPGDHRRHLRQLRPARRRRHRHAAGGGRADGHGSHHDQRDRQRPGQRGDRQVGEGVRHGARGPGKSVSAGVKKSSPPARGHDRAVVISAG